jgi:hypothetical protein
MQRNAMERTHRIDQVVEADGTITTTTPDEGQPYFAEARAKEVAEINAACDAFRERGIRRPVVVCLGDRRRIAMAVWEKIVPQLRRLGKPVFSTGADGLS